MYWLKIRKMKKYTGCSLLSLTNNHFLFYKNEWFFVLLVVMVCKQLLWSTNWLILWEGCAISSRRISSWPVNITVYKHAHYISTPSGKWRINTIFFNYMKLLKSFESFLTIKRNEVNFPQLTLFLRFSSMAAHMETRQIPFESRNKSFIRNNILPIIYLYNCKKCKVYIEFHFVFWFVFWF